MYLSSIFNFPKSFHCFYYIKTLIKVYKLCNTVTFITQDELECLRRMRQCTSQTPQSDWTLLPSFSVPHSLSCSTCSSLAQPPKMWICRCDFIERTGVSDTETVDSVKLCPTAVVFPIYAESPCEFAMMPKTIWITVWEPGNSYSITQREIIFYKIQWY